MYDVNNSTTMQYFSFIESVVGIDIGNGATADPTGAGKSLTVKWDLSIQ
jgi:hypothetical protein